MKQYIPYGRQFIDNKDKKFVSNSLSNDLITTGPYVKKFEYKLKNILNYGTVMFVTVELPRFI